MPDTDSTFEQHYETLSPDHQLIWRLQARRDAEDEFLYIAGDTLEAWTLRLGALHDVGFEVRRALDVMMFSLLDPPAATRPGLRRTAWAILHATEPFESLGQEDAARLEARARADTGQLIDPESFNDAVIDACIGEEARLAEVLSPPGHQYLMHPAATSADYLRYAAHQGLILDSASPDLQAAILRFLDTDVTLRTHASTILKARHDHQQHEAHLDARHVQAAICITTVIRLLYLPQLVPGHIPNVIAAQRKAYDAGAIACGKSLQVAEYLSQVDSQTYFVPSKVVTDTALAGLPPGIEVNVGCNGPDMVITNGVADRSWFAFLISDTRGNKTFTFTPTALEAH